MIGLCVRARVIALKSWNFIALQLWHSIASITILLISVAPQGGVYEVSVSLDLSCKGGGRGGV